MEEMARASYAAGVRYQCFTDHCDPVDWMNGGFFPRCREIPALVRAARDELLPALPADMTLCAGMELGESHFYPDVAREIVAGAKVDFILGSYHISPQYGDYYGIHYTSPQQCEELFDLYLDGLQTLAEWDIFDVMAHIGYFRRYAWAQGVDAALTAERFEKKLTRLFRTLIQNGRGIEINCSGIRDGCGPLPGEDVLRLYRSLGGRLVTIGSDAHCTRDAAKGLRRGLEILREVGFEQVAFYVRREPRLLPIGELLNDNL